MAENLGNVVGLIKQETAPSKTYVIWAKILNPAFPEIVELFSYNADTAAWEPLRGDDSVSFVELTEGASNIYAGTPGFTMDAYNEGARIVVKPDVTNTGAVTWNIASLGNRAVEKTVAGVDTALASGDFRSNTYYVAIITAAKILLLPSEQGAGGGGGLLAVNNLNDVDNDVTSFTNIKQAATTSVTGVSKQSTTATVDTGSATDEHITPDALNGSAPAILATNIAELVDTYLISLSAIDGDLTVSTVKDSFRVRYAGTITEVSGIVETAPTGSSAIFDVNINGTTTMTTDKIEIDATEDDSKDATTQPALTTTAVALNDKISVDVDQKGSTIAGAGGKVYVHIKRT